jgi:hypothetical protein
VSFISLRRVVKASQRFAEICREPGFYLAPSAWTGLGSGWLGLGQFGRSRYSGAMVLDQIVTNRIVTDLEGQLLALA